MDPPEFRVLVAVLAGCDGRGAIDDPHRGRGRVSRQPSLAATKSYL
jgi:hypothetical protein